MTMLNAARWGRIAVLRQAEGGAAPGGGEAMAGEAAAAAAAAAGGAAEGAVKWFEDQRFSEDHRSYLAAKGLNAASDPMDAVQKLIGIGQAADRRFGRPLDGVIDKPAKDQPLADWRRAHAETFGLPKDADGYEIKRPEGLAEGVAWSDDLAGRMKSLAYERGLAPDDVQAMTEMYAGYVNGVNADIDRDMQAAEARLNGELAKMWGRDVEANKARARQAAGALAEAAGLDQDGIASVVGLLSSGQPGETNALRMFAALGTMMGEDRAVGIGQGVGALGMGRDEAQRAFAEFMAEDGAFAKATRANDSEAVARLRPTYERLSRQLATAR